MHIARIIEYFPPHIGGMEGHGLNLSFEQCKSGHFVEVFIGHGNKNWYKDWGFSKFCSSINTYKAPFQFLPLYNKIRRLWFNFWAYNKVKKVHKRNPFDIIHLHGDFVEAFFGGKLSKKLNIPAILTVHAGLNKRFLKLKNARHFSNISKIICVSEEISGDLKSISIPENKIAIISSGIYLVRFEKVNINQEHVTALHSKYSKPIIISIGVLRPAKGFKYLIETFKEIKEKFNDATLFILGDGPDKIRLEKQAQRINGIYFLGRQNNDRVIEYLKAADIFVLASIFMERDREGTPNTIMEAMAAGLPIVATKVGGIPELIKNNVNGIVVAPGDSSALASALAKLLNNGKLRRKMSEKNLEDIKQKDWPIIAKLIDKVYESVI